MRSIPPDHSPGARRMVQLAASLAPPWSVLRDAALRAAPQDEGGLGLTKWPRGRRNPLKRLDSRKGKSLNFASPGLDFPSLRLGFFFLKAWIFLPQDLDFPSRLGFGAPRGRSERADAHQIVEMHDTDHLAALHHQKRRDLVADRFQRLGDERVRRDRAGLLGDYARDLGVEGKIRLQMTAQVAVGEDADEPAAVFEHRYAAEALRRHLDDRLGHPGARLDPRDALAGMHDVADMGEPGPELAA